jgi:hypothetical protein
VTKQRPRQATRRSFRPQAEALEARLVPSQFFEAETALLGGIGPYFDGTAINNYPRVEDVHTSGQTNYDGPGYVNLAYSDDSTLTWVNVPEDQAGDYTLSFRYSMDTYYTDAFIPARPMGLMVNGDVITRVLNFQATGDSSTGVDPWSIWSALSITVRLNAGVNTIELFAVNLGATGANPHLDSLTVTPVAGGMAPAAPTSLTASAGIGDVDLQWMPSAIASTYNVYRSTSSGSETLIASGVTATYFFDTGLATDGTGYFYRVSAVNSVGESAASNEASGAQSALAGLLFSDDFSAAPSSAWTFTPAAGYWVPQVGQLTDSGGDTVAGAEQTATLTLPSGAASLQADLLTKEGHGAAVDQQGNPGTSGIFIQSADGSSAVYFAVSDDYTLNVGTAVGGVWQGWTQVGTAPTVMHAYGVELLRHTYQIRLDSGGTFSVLFDGNVLGSGISAGPASAWAGGIAAGSLFTNSYLDERHLSTSFDNVRVFGFAAAPMTSPDTTGTARLSLPGQDSGSATSFNLYQAAGSGNESLISTSIASTALADFGLSNRTASFLQVTTAHSAGEHGPFHEFSAKAKGMAWLPDAFADPTETWGSLDC